MSYNLLAISGSLRKNSTNTGLLRAFESLTPDGVTLSFASIGDLPLFNEDDEVECYPAAATLLKTQIRDADGIIIATPEYNRGTTGVLKNAIDWSTRPDKDNPWVGKPVYVVGASSGTLGTVNAQYELKRSLTYLKAYVLGQPEFYVTFNKTKFSLEGALTDEDTRVFIRKAIVAFTAHIDRMR